MRAATYELVVEEYDTEIETTDAFDKYVIENAVFKVTAFSLQEAIGNLSVRIGRGILAARVVNFNGQDI